MLGTKEKDATRVLLNFFNSLIPVFEEFLLLFQKSSPVIHIQYESTCEILSKLLRRFVQSGEVDGKYGVALGSIDCKDVKLQLADKDIVIGDATRKALKELPPEQRRHTMLGIRSFLSTATSYLQQKLPLGNQILKQCRCLNPANRNEESTVRSIQSLASSLQPRISETGVTDEWKLFQADTQLPTYNPKERIEVFWNQVFKIQSATGEPRYQLLPIIIKSALTLGQTNADAERSLSANAQLVTHDRASLGEKTIIGLRTLREAVRFCDPIAGRPEQLEISPALKRAVKSAHASYKEQMEREKEVKLKKEEEEQRQRELSEKQQRERSKLLQKKESLAKSEEDLSQQEQLAREEVSAADELLKDAKLKLDEALGCTVISKSSVAAAKMMLETATAKQKEAMAKLDQIQEQRKAFRAKTHRLLDEILPSKQVTQKKRSSETEKEGKRVKRK